MNKRGAVEMSSTGGVILLVVITIILLFVLGAIVSTYAQTSDVAECQWSRAVRELVPAGQTLFNLNCPRRYIQVTDRPLQVSYTILGNREGNSARYTFPFHDGERIIPKQTVTDSEELNALVANEMSRCWQLFDGGNRDAIGAHVRALSWGDRNTCIICTEIEVAANIERSTQNLYEYLENTPSATRPEESYLDYLYSPFAASSPNECARNVIDDELGAHILESLYLERGEQYVVTSIRRGKNKISSVIRDKLENIDDGWCHTTVVMPVQELAKSCDFILN